MRQISFALTTKQFRNRTKSVTRRAGWEFLRAGDRLQGIEKGQGLRKGEHPVKLGVIEVTDVRRERLEDIAPSDVVFEGFPEMSVREFVEMFAASHRMPTFTAGEPSGSRPMEPADFVTRIAYRYVDEVKQS